MTQQWWMNSWDAKGEWQSGIWSLRSKTPECQVLSRLLSMDTDWLAFSHMLRILRNESMYCRAGLLDNVCFLTNELYLYWSEEIWRNLLLQMLYTLDSNVFCFLCCPYKFTVCSLHFCAHIASKTNSAWNGAAWQHHSTLWRTSTPGCHWRWDDSMNSNYGRNNC